MAISIYWEKQVAGLCGVHCINALLQGPMTTEVDLAQIAQQLDAQEHALMMEAGMTPDYQRFATEGSGNVALDGNYSSQVLTAAFGVWDLAVIPIDREDAKDAKDNPVDEKGFICHTGDHWFAIRRINGHWWNLNSMNKHGPEHVSDLYLSMMLQQLNLEGFTVYVVRGEYPSSNALGDSFNSSRGQWVSCMPPGSRAADGGGGGGVQAFGGTGYRLDGGGGGGGGGGDDGMSAAIAASLADFGGDGNDSDMDPDMAAAIAASLADVGSAAAVAPPSPSPSHVEVPPEPEAGSSGGITAISVRTPDGLRLIRRFSPTHTVAHVYAWLAQEGHQGSLLDGISRANVPNTPATLTEAGLHPNAALTLMKQ